MRARRACIAATVVICAIVVFCASVSACDPTVVIGARVCPPSPRDSGPAVDSDAALGCPERITDAGPDQDAARITDAGPDRDAAHITDAGPDRDAARLCLESSTDAGVAPDPDASVPLSWTTGFEDGFCDYALPLGYCYASGSGSYSLVTSPVHSGHYAAAFTVLADVDGGGSQARCVVQGVFSQAAYYGAWYYVPESATNSGNWNLLHFQGGVAGEALNGLWDLSLINLGDGGALHTNLVDYAREGGLAAASAAIQIPIGEWFHLEVYFKRESDATGQLSILQGGAVVANLTGLETDYTHWGQWYVGNLANSLLPSSSTVYVDDVTIGPAP